MTTAAELPTWAAMLFQYYVLAALVLAVWYGLYALWKKRLDEDVAAGAAVEYEHYRAHDPDFVRGLSKDEFQAIYRRVETPPGPFHTFLAVAVFLLGAPLVLAATTLTIGSMERAGVIPQPGEQAQRLQLSADGIRLVREADLTTLQYILQGWGGFFSFFALLVFWVVIFYLLMRRSHSKRAGSLREEVLRSR